MRVFLTGASGFIGQSLLRHLREEGHEVTALLRPGRSESLAHGATIAWGDVTRPESLAGTLRGMDAVLHCAGSVGRQRWDTCIAVNRDGTRHLAAEAVRAGVRRFVHLSSVSVYGRVADVPIREDAPFRRIGDPYGDTKIDAELILQEHVRAGRLDLTVIRPTVVYGPGDTKFIASLLRNARGRTVRMVGDGTQRVDLVHAEDLARFVTRALAEPRTIGKAYNLTNPVNPSWNELLEAVKKEHGSDTQVRHLPYWFAYGLGAVMEGVALVSGREPKLTRYSARVVGRNYNYVVEAAQQDLGFAPAIDLLEGIRDCLRTAGRVQAKTV